MIPCILSGPLMVNGTKNKYNFLCLKLHKILEEKNLLKVLGTGKVQRDHEHGKQGMKKIFISWHDY